VSGNYQKIGRTVIFQAQLGIGSTTTFSGNIWIGLPFATPGVMAFLATLYNGSTFNPIWCYASNSAAELFAMNTASTYAVLEYASSTKPVTLGNNMRFYVSGSYESTT